MSNYCKLIMIAVNENPKNNQAAQSNKYYEMIDDDSGIIKVKYGRVESTETNITKPLNQWNTLIKSKIKKGYTNVTGLVSNSEKTSKVTLVSLKEQAVERFLKLMQDYTNKLVSSTYSVKATNVTLRQIEKAQEYIDRLKNDQSNWATVNENLLALYTVIPRKMGKVQDYLFPQIKIEDILEQEQDNLDAISSQVKQLVIQDDIVGQETNILSELGIENMSEITAEQAADLKYLLNQIRTHTVKSIFKLNKKNEDSKFGEYINGTKNKDTRILIHGTKCASVIPILEQGLKIRPSGSFQFSGKVYGDGSYFSEVVQKSLGYTGYSLDKILLVYEVHTGEPFKYSGWYSGNSFPLNYLELRKRGFNSTYVSAGNGLLNSEIISYNEDQCRIKYIIHLQ